jgi:hypothetical protein
MKIINFLGLVKTNQLATPKVTRPPKFSDVVVGVVVVVVVSHGH